MRPQPPSRYTEATLVKALEELGIGRPWTYATIIGTILDRGYVWKKGSALVPSFLAFSVVTLLEKHFGELVDYDFTARMEEDLDLVAGGDAERLATLERFYYGRDEAGTATAEGFRGLHPMVSDLGEIDARSINSIPIGKARTAMALVSGRSLRPRISSATGPATTASPDRAGERP